jgi:hypothetical protein
LDISSFFPSVTENRVRLFYLRTMKCSPDVARILAQISTRNGHLPTGSTLSPITAFYAFRDLWDCIDFLCKESGRSFTLYVDDLTISGPGSSPDLIYRIKRLVRRAGLEIKVTKERHFARGTGIVTGVHIGRCGLNAPKSSHLKLHELRLRYASEKDAGIRLQMKQRLQGIESQHAQIAQANAVVSKEQQVSLSKRTSKT